MKNHNHHRATEEMLSERRRLEEDFDATQEAVNRTISKFNAIGNGLGKSIPEKLIELKVFQNASFSSFLLHLLRTCEFFHECNHRDGTKDGRSFTEEEERACFGSARFMMATIPFKATDRKEAESFFAVPEVMAFISEYIDTVPYVRKIAKTDSE